MDAVIQRMAIHDVVLRYCRGIDRMDQELVRSCYHADATDEHGSFAGTVDEYLVWVFRLLAKYDSTQHLLANHLVDFGGGSPASGVAVSESYGVSVHQTADGGPSRNLAVGFRFVDRFDSALATALTCVSYGGTLLAYMVVFVFAVWIVL